MDILCRQNYLSNTFHTISIYECIRNFQMIHSFFKSKMADEKRSTVLVVTTVK